MQVIREREAAASIEDDDSLDELNEQIGFPILDNRFDGTHFCDPDFTPMPPCSSDTPS